MTTKGVCAAAAALLLLSSTGAGAQTGACFDVDSCKAATDRPASLLVFPKIAVDSDAGVDTVIHLVNVSPQPTGVRCSYLNATSRCQNDGSPCETNSDCPGFASCVAGWVETDFRVTLTQNQPLSWNASRGLTFLPCDFSSPDGVACAGRNDGRIPPVAETPFIGELKCIQVDDADAPLDFNELTGAATVIRADGGLIDVSKYDAIGVQAIPGANDNDNVLCLGGVAETDECPQPEYAGCPQTLIMNHFFDGATPAGTPPVTTSLTVVPCAEDLLNATAPPSITVQLLLYNEFEQRTSTSFRFRCFASQTLSDISSIFSITTQGTLSGQTRINAVSSGARANGILGLMEETRPCDVGPDFFCSTAGNLHHQGRRALNDVIQLP